MLNFGPTFIWTIVNLIILYIVLRKVLFKRVTAFMENRTQSIQKAIATAEKNQAEAQELKKSYASQLDAARKNADQILVETRTHAEKEYAEIVAAARQEAARVIEKARMDMEREHEQMLKEIKGQIAGLALAAATKVLEANMDNDRNRVLVDNFIDEEGVA